MVQVSNEFIQGLKESRVRLNMEIETAEKKFTLNFDDISSFSYEASSMGRKKLTFGGISAAALDFMLLYNDNRWNNENLIGATVRPVFYVPDVPDRVPLGIFTIEEAIRKQGDCFVRCMDAMVKFDIKWDFGSGFTFPCTATALLKKLCEDAGVPYSGKNPELSFTIKAEKPFKGKTLRNILNLVSETQGMYTVINRSGELQLKCIGGEPVYTVDYEDMTEFLQDEKEISPNGASVEIKGEEYKDEQEKDGLAYYIRLSQNNELLKGRPLDKLMDILNNIANILKDLTYLPCELETPFGNPALEAGDIITVTDKEGNPHKAVISTIDFSDNFSMRITSAGESAELNEQDFMGGISNKINDAMNIEGLPDMSGYRGAFLKTNGTEASWSKSDSSIKVIRPVDGVLTLDAIVDMGVYGVVDAGSSIMVSIINTNTLLPDAVKDIILIFPVGPEVTIAWGGNILPGSDDIRNTEPNRLNEYALRCYRCFNTTWLLTRHVFDVKAE